MLASVFTNDATAWSTMVLASLTIVLGHVGLRQVRLTDKGPGPGQKRQSRGRPREQPPEVAHGDVRPVAVRPCGSATSDSTGCREAVAIQKPTAARSEPRTIAAKPAIVSR